MWRRQVGFCEKLLVQRVHWYLSPTVTIISSTFSFASVIWFPAEKFYQNIYSSGGRDMFKLIKFNLWPRKIVISRPHSLPVRPGEPHVDSFNMPHTIKSLFELKPTHKTTELWGTKKTNHCIIASWNWGRQYYKANLFIVKISYLALAVLGKECNDISRISCSGLFSSPHLVQLTWFSWNVQTWYAFCSHLCLWKINQEKCKGIICSKWSISAQVMTFKTIKKQLKDFVYIFKLQVSTSTYWGNYS